LNEPAFGFESLGFDKGAKTYLVRVAKTLLAPELGLALCWVVLYMQSTGLQGWFSGGEEGRRYLEVRLESRIYQQKRWLTLLTPLPQLLRDHLPRARFAKWTPTYKAGQLVAWGKMVATPTKLTNHLLIILVPCRRKLVDPSPYQVTCRPSTCPVLITATRQTSPVAPVRPRRPRRRSSGLAPVRQRLPHSESSPPSPRAPLVQRRADVQPKPPVHDGGLNIDTTAVARLGFLAFAWVP